MEHYIIAFKNSVITDVYSAKNLSNIKPEFVYFICRTENICSYGYGSHDKYVICDNTGKECPLNVEGYLISSFITHGTQSDFMLTWTIIHDGIEEQYSLISDHRWYIQPAYDVEWNDPVKETTALIDDIRTIGFPARKEMDGLLRSIYQQNSEIERALHHHFLLRNIDYEKSGILFNYRPEELPCYHKNYKKISARLKRNAERMIGFLREEQALREQTIARLKEGNEKYETVASTLCHVYLREGVSAVDAKQFYACRNVEAITLPASVQTIVHTAFNFKQRLSAVYVTSNKIVHLIPDFPSPGIMTDSVCFFVPKELLDSYKSNMFWNEVSKNIFPIPQ